MVTSDPLAVLAAREDVAAAVAAARDEVDAVLWRRDVRAAAAAVVAASAERGARDSAAIDGADVAVADDSPMGRVLQAAFRTTLEVPGLVTAFSSAPLQALAQLNSAAARGFSSPDELGRPRIGGRPDDPLNLGSAPPPAAAADRMVRLARVLTTATTAPAIVVAAIAHAEVATVRPFAWGSGLVARATVRLVLADRGVDPSLFTVPERGMIELGRAGYVRALRAYAGGTPTGVSEWIVWQATAIAVGARAVVVP